MKIKSYLLLSAVLLSGCRIGTPDGPRHEFALLAAPPSLTEELAIAYAGKAMELDGYSTNDWSLWPVPEPLTSAMKKSPYKFLIPISSDVGGIGFTRNSETRDYIVQLNGDRVISYRHGGL